MFQVQNKAIFFGFYQIFQSLLNISLSIWFVVGIGLNWQGRIEGQVVASIICGVIGICILWKNGFLQISYNKKYVKDILHLGFPLIPFGLGGFLLTISDRVFISNMVGLEETGLYTIGYQFGMIINIFQMSFNKAWLPWLFSKLKENLQTDKVKIVKVTYIYFVILTLMALILSLFAPWIMKMFLGPEFNNSSQFVFWIAIGFAFNGMQKMVVSYIQFEKKNYLLSTITFLTVGINLIANYFLIKINGAIGAAQATAISYLLIFILTWFMSARIVAMPWNLFRKGQIDLDRKQNKKKIS